MVSLGPDLDLARDGGDLGVGGVGGAGRRRGEESGDDVGASVVERVEEGEDHVGDQWSYGWHKNMFEG